jgi:exopolysaccharide biosynthesis polyprenyl glycosylphosphotransferase
VPFTSRQGAITWLRALDLALAAFSLLAAATLSTSLVPETAGAAHLHVDAGSLGLLFGLFLATAVIFPFFGVYAEAALYDRRQAVKQVVKSVTGVVMVLLLGAAALRPPLATPVFLASYWLTAVMGCLAARLALRRLLFMGEAQGVLRRRVLVVGTGQRAQEIAREMLAHPEQGRRFMGFVADGWEVAPTAAMPEAGKLVCRPGELADYLREQVVDEVVICLSLEQLCHSATALVTACEEQGVTATVVARLFELANPRSRPGIQGGEVVATLSSSLADEREHILKRFFDVAVSLSALIALSPLLAVAFGLVRLTSPGPAIFAQERVGLGKRKFMFYKFRTMVQNAPEMQEALEARNEMDGALFKIKNDPRVTPLGRWLRRTSIDELPQLYNVLRGDMSLVGPRPLPLRDVERIEKTWPRRRFGVKPGITCLWQISGRNATSFDRMMELDIEYVDTWSLAMDLKILLRTIPVVCSMRGAY